MKAKEYLRHVLESCYQQLHKYKFKNMSLYKNISRGGQCFIVCNGPSLTESDLNMLADSGIPSFGTNRIYNIYPNTKWRPNYAVIMDEGLMYDKLSLQAISDGKPEVFFLNKNAAYTARDLTCDVCLVDSDWSKILLNAPKFSTDAAKGIYGIGTVTYSCIQIAYYMGFRSLYILGADNKYPWTHLQDGSHNFDNKARSYFAGLDSVLKKPAMGATWEMNIAYDYAQYVSESLGMKIYNATRGGYLESFERIELEAALQQIKRQTVKY